MFQRRATGDPRHEQTDAPQLERHLLAAADILGDSMAASASKDHILGVLFLTYAPDEFAIQHDEVVAEQLARPGHRSAPRPPLNRRHSTGPSPSRTRTRWPQMRDHLHKGHPRRPQLCAQSPGEPQLGRVMLDHEDGWAHLARLAPTLWLGLEAEPSAGAQ